MGQPQNTTAAGHALGDARGSVYQAAAVCALLFLAVGLVFGQTVHYDFINMDDPTDVYLNPHITGGLSAKAVKWAFADFCGGAWMPLTCISHTLDCQLYGLRAGGHHLTNVLLHGITAVLLFVVLREMTGRMWPSALVAAVFAVHPLRVESVAWVTERKDVLSGLFFMLTLAAYVGYVRRRFSLVRYAAVIVLFALGLMAKPALLTLPFVLLLLDYWPLGRWSRPNAVRLVLEKVPLLALTALSFVVSVWAYGLEQISLVDPRLPLWWRIENAPISYASYLGMFFYPANLATPYPRLGLDLPLGKVFGSVLLLVVLTVAALAAGRRRPYLLVGWLWYVGMLVPASGVVQFGMQSMADRYTYLPQIGLCLALAWGMADALGPWPRLRPVCGAAAALLVGVLMLCAWRQTSFWRDSVTLWTHMLARTSPNAFTHNSLGNAYFDLGQMDKAIEQYQAAVAVNADYGMSHYNLGVALARIGRTDDAIDQFQKAIQLFPRRAGAQNNSGAGGFLARFHYNLGVALASAGRLEEAMEQYRKTIQHQPNHAGAHNNLGTALYVQRRFDEAMAHLQAAIRIDPHFAEAHFNAGNIWHYRGDLDKAMAEYQEALKANPNFAQARYALGLILARRRRWDEAIAEYRTALEASPPFAAEVHNSLGLALAARGRTEEAAVQYRSALALRPDFAKARRNLDKLLAGGSGNP